MPVTPYKAWPCLEWVGFGTYGQAFSGLNWIRWVAVLMFLCQRLTRASNGKRKANPFLITRLETRFMPRLSPFALIFNPKCYSYSGFPSYQLHFTLVFFLFGSAKWLNWHCKENGLLGISDRQKSTIFDHNLWSYPGKSKPGPSASRLLLLLMQYNVFLSFFSLLLY